MIIILRTKDGLDCRYDLFLRPGDQIPMDIGMPIKSNNDNNPVQRVRIYKYKYAMVGDLYLYEEDHTDIR